MWVKSIQIKNIKSFADSEAINFSQRMNVLVGPNNSGKSTVLRSVQLLQRTDKVTPFFDNATRIGTKVEDGNIQIKLGDPNAKQLPFTKQIKSFHIEEWKGLLRFVRPPAFDAHYICTTGPVDQFLNVPGNQSCFNLLPDNFIYAYFSNRKTSQFNHTINQSHAQTLEETFQHLPSKIDHLTNPDLSSSTEFRDICKRIFGFPISSVQWKGTGKHPGLTLSESEFLPINSMGEGTIQILSFLAHLCGANGKLFLIEDIEADLHPKALKTLLEYVIEKSLSNQFIVCTHNNIVAKYLGGVPDAKVFVVEMRLDTETKVPTSTCVQVADNEQARMGLLESLGYEPSDYFLWKGYLILEESTAERLIRDFLIPFLVPQLQGKIKTIASNGITNVEKRLDDLMRLFVFVNSSPQYKERAWVAVDNGEKGKEVIDKLKLKFKTWPVTHFKLFSLNCFEDYYPPRFHEKASKVLKMSNGLPKQDAKGELACEVLKWALDNNETAQKEFSIYAKEVLDFLNEIAAKLL